MQLFIIRHGEAELETKPDSARQLNLQGQQECESAGHWIGKQCRDFDLVLISPFVRTQQTWEMLEKQGITTKKIETLQDLTPESDPETTACAIKAYSQGLTKVLVISHLPLVCFLVDELVAETCPLFATGSTAVVEIEETDIKGHLLTLISPNQAEAEINSKACAAGR